MSASLNEIKGKILVAIQHQANYIYDIGPGSANFSESEYIDAISDMEAYTNLLNDTLEEIKNYELALETLERETAKKAAEILARFNKVPA